MQGNDQMAYDRATTTFSPDGQLYQVDYAREAVKQGSPVLAVRASDAVVLAAARPVRSPLQVTESVEKLHRVDDHLAVASAGHAADGRALVDRARHRAQVERVRYGEPLGVETLAKDLAAHVQESTQTGGTRPYGTALLVAGVDHTGPRLFETDPSGTPYEWRAAAVGRNANAIRDYLADEHEDGLSLDAARRVATLALDASVDDGLSPENTGVGWVDADGVHVLDESSRRGLLAETDVLETDSGQ